MNKFIFIKILIFLPLLTLLNGCTTENISDETVIKSKNNKIVGKQVSKDDVYYTSNKFGLKIKHVEYLYDPDGDHFIFEDDNKIFSAYLQHREEITDLDSCDKFFRRIHDKDADVCAEVNGNFYMIGDKMNIFEIDKELDLEENINQLLEKNGKDPEDCTISITNKDYRKDEYAKSDPLVIKLNYLPDKENEIYAKLSPLFKRDDSGVYPIEYHLAKVRAYKQILLEEDKMEDDLMAMLSEVEKSLEEGDENAYIEMSKGRRFWGNLRQRRCGLFEAQFLLNGGRLVYFPQRPNILISINGGGGGAGPDLYDVELAD